MYNRKVSVSVCSGSNGCVGTAPWSLISFLRVCASHACLLFEKLHWSYTPGKDALSLICSSLSLSELARPRMGGICFWQEKKKLHIMSGLNDGLVLHRIRALWSFSPSTNRQPSGWICLRSSRTRASYLAFPMYSMAPAFPTNSKWPAEQSLVSLAFIVWQGHRNYLRGHLVPMRPSADWLYR